MTTQATPVPARPAPPPIVRQILVTGASGGIGQATVVRLADAGHVVFAAARRADALEALAATHPGVRPVVLDITDQAAIDHARHQLTDQTGGHGLDVVINAAGILVSARWRRFPTPDPGPVRGQPVRHPGRHAGVPAADAPARCRPHRECLQHPGPLRAAGQRAVRGVEVRAGGGLGRAANGAGPLRRAGGAGGAGVIDTALYQRAAAALPDDQALGPYRASWPAGLGFPQRLLRAAASVDTIAATLADAALAPRPPARDRPGLRNRLTTRLLTTLPTRASDRIKRRIAGLAPSPTSPTGPWCQVGMA